MDVWIIFWVDVFQFGMECCIACAGQTGIAFVDLDEGISFVEVDVVIVAGEPGGSGVGDLVGLGREGLVLNEAAEGFGIAEVFLEGGGWSYAGAQFLLVVTTGEAVSSVLIPGNQLLYRGCWCWGFGGDPPEYMTHHVNSNQRSRICLTGGVQEEQCVYEYVNSQSEAVQRGRRRVWGQLFGIIMRKARQNSCVPMEAIALLAGMSTEEWLAVESGMFLIRRC